MQDFGSQSPTLNIQNSIIAINHSQNSVLACLIRDLQSSYLLKTKEHYPTGRHALEKALGTQDLRWHLKLGETKKILFSKNSLFFNHPEDWAQCLAVWSPCCRFRSNSIDDSYVEKFSSNYGSPDDDQWNAARFRMMASFGRFVHLA